jgi:hypothetical protein
MVVNLSDKAVGRATPAHHPRGMNRSVDAIDSGHHPVRVIRIGDLGSSMASWMSTTPRR